MDGWKRKVNLLRAAAVAGMQVRGIGTVVNAPPQPWNKEASFNVTLGSPTVDFAASQILEAGFNVTLASLSADFSAAQVLTTAFSETLASPSAAFTSIQILEALFAETLGSITAVFTASQTFEASFALTLASPVVETTAVQELEASFAVVLGSIAADFTAAQILESSFARTLASPVADFTAAQILEVLFSVTLGSPVASLNALQGLESSFDVTLGSPVVLFVVSAVVTPTEFTATFAITLGSLTVAFTLNADGCASTATALDNDLVPAIYDLLEELGKPAVFVDEVSTYDPATGAITVVSSTPYTRTITPPSQYKRKFNDRDLTNRSAVLVYVAAQDLPFTPVKGMEVQFDSLTWEIVKADVVWTGSEIGLYALLLAGCGGVVVPATGTTTLDDDLVTATLALLDEFGKQLIFQVPGTDTYDPATGLVSQSSFTPHTVLGTPPDNYREYFVDSRVIQRGDVRTFVAPPSNFTVAPGLTVEFDSVSKEVVGVGLIYSGIQVVLLEVQLRGAGLPIVITTRTTTLDDDLVSGVLSLVEELGKSVAFVMFSTDDYDPATGAVTQAGITTHCRNILPPAPYESQYVDGDLIQFGDSQTFIAQSGLTFDPFVGQQVIIDSDYWVIVAVLPVYSGEQVVMQELALRQ